jgi:hypothetical protein
MSSANVCVHRSFVRWLEKQNSLALLKCEIGKKCAARVSGVVKTNRLPDDDDDCEAGT